MKPYESLTPGGKKKRLAKLVAQGLETYDIKVESIKYLDTHTNMFFKITDDEQNTYAAKMVMDPFIALEDNMQELSMLETIAANSDVKVPKVKKNKEGKGIITVESIYAPQAHRMVVYDWFHGQNLDGHESQQTFKAVGTATAKLHQALQNFEPVVKEVKRWNQVFYFNGEHAIYNKEDYAHLVASETIQVLDKAIKHLDKHLPKLYEEGHESMMHGDLHQWNIKKHNGELVIFDFEDNLLGMPIHDMAITLYYYRYDKRFDFNDIITWYLEGYETIRPMPNFSKENLEMLMMARRVNFMNYILLFNDKPQTFLETNTQRVKAYLDSLKTK